MPRAAKEGDWARWQVGFGGGEKVGQVVQVLDPISRDPRDGGHGFLIRELTADGLGGPLLHVRQFEIRAVGMTPLEILARA